MVFNILLALLVLLIAGLSFWALIRYLVYRAFHFAQIHEKQKPDSSIFQYQELLIPTENGKKIQLYDLNPTSNASVVVVAIHGWANTSEVFLPAAKELVKTCRLFLVNARNHGKSDKEKLMTILKFETDLSNALTYVLNQVNAPKQVIVLGHSLGAAAGILTAADDKRVDGVVSISAFADVRRIMYGGFRQNGIPPWLIKVVLKYIEWKIGRPFNEISPLYAIRRFYTPVLLIHGDKDELVPFDDMEKIKFTAKRHNVETFVAKGHGHSSLLKEPAVIKAIKSFLNKYFMNS